MFLMKDNQIRPAKVRVSTERTYTLKEIEESTRMFVDNFRCDDYDKVLFSAWLAWAQKREKDGNDN